MAPQNATKDSKLKTVEEKEVGIGSLKRHYGVTRSLKESQGVSMSLKKSQGVTRSLKESQ